MIAIRLNRLRANELVASLAGHSAWTPDAPEDDALVLAGPATVRVQTPRLVGIVDLDEDIDRLASFVSKHAQNSIHCIVPALLAHRRQVSDPLPASQAHLDESVTQLRLPRMQPCYLPQLTNRLQTPGLIEVEHRKQALKGYGGDGHSFNSDH